MEFRVAAISTHGVISEGHGSQLIRVAARKVQNNWTVRMLIITDDEPLNETEIWEPVSKWKV